MKLNVETTILYMNSNVLQTNAKEDTLKKLLNSRTPLFDKFPPSQPMVTKIEELKCKFLKLQGLCVDFGVKSEIASS